MWLPRKSRWLVCLTVMLLIGCGNKKEGGGAVPPAAAPAKGATVPATASATPQQGKLVILPETPTANDKLLAIFHGDSGRANYRWEKDGKLLEGEERDRLAASQLKKGALITVTVENNGVRYSTSVTIGNLPPVVQKVSFKNPAIHRGVDIELDVTGADADGDDIVFLYQWFCNGTQIDPIDGPKLPGDRFSRGDRISFLVVPFDGMNEGPPYQGRAITIPNAPPVFISSPPLQFLSNTYSYQAQAEDPDGDEITYALENPPSAMTIDSKTGQINWNLTVLPAGVYRINIIADDGQGQKGYQDYSLTMSRQ